MGIAPVPRRPATGEARSSGARDDLRLGCMGVALAALVWLFNVAVQAALFRERSLWSLVTSPEERDLYILSLLLFLVGSFLYYSRRILRERGELQQALQDALLMAETERANVVSVMEAIGDAISIQDMDLKVLYQNRAHQQLLGDHAGEFCYRAYLSREEPCPDCHLKGSFADGKAHRVEKTMQLGPEQRWVEIIASPLKDREGRVAAGIEVVRDVTSRKKAEAEILELNRELTHHAAELQIANRELEAFSSAVSHDLRTPLTRIFCSSQALEEYSEQLDENGRFFVGSIYDGCLQMEGLIDSLLVLSRVSEAEMRQEEVDLSRLAREIGTSLSLSHPTRKVTFNVAPGLTAMGDRPLIGVVLENLIGNAWKYTARRDHAIIEFGCRREGGETVYYLKDNGAGFSMEQADRLFKPFHRLHSSQEFPGSGVGLATVQRIILRHKGRVWGEGKPGEGATFSFTLGEGAATETVAPSPRSVL